MHKIRADRPLDENIQTVLHQFDHASRTLGIDYFLVGATARDLMLTHVFGIDPGRATRDIDFAVAIPDWNVFEQIKSSLLSHSNSWSVSPAVQRLIYRGNDGHFSTPVDLVPFGHIENPPDTIHWPPDMAVVMNVAGYTEALQSSAHIRIKDDLVVRVASIPGLAVLKLFAWTDRGLADSKDAHDLLMLLRRYEEAGNHDRLYGEELPLLEACGYDPALAAARLLGTDVRASVDDVTTENLLSILNDDATLDRLRLHMARSLNGTDDGLTYINNLLVQFKAGITSMVVRR